MNQFNKHKSFAKCHLPNSLKNTYPNGLKNAQNRKCPFLVTLFIMMIFWGCFQTFDAIIRCKSCCSSANGLLALSLSPSFRAVSARELYFRLAKCCAKICWHSTKLDSYMSSSSCTNSIKYADDEGHCAQFTWHCVPLCDLQQSKQASTAVRTQIPSWWCKHHFT